MADSIYLNKHAAVRAVVGVVCVFSMLGSVLIVISYYCLQTGKKQGVTSTVSCTRSTMYSAPSCVCGLCWRNGSVTLRITPQDGAAWSMWSPTTLLPLLATTCGYTWGWLCAHRCMYPSSSTCGVTQLSPIIHHSCLLYIVDTAKSIMYGILWLVWTIQ